MKRKDTKPESAPAKSRATADQTLHIEWPWSMTWGEHMDEMLAFLKTQVGPGHPLHRKKLYVSAVNKDADAWYVEGEKEDLYAIVYLQPKEAVWGQVHAQVRNSRGLARRAATVCCGSQGIDAQSVMLTTIRLDWLTFVEPAALHTKSVGPCN